MKNWQAYISYYGDNLINDFNIKESDNIKLYNIKDNIGINNLHYHYANLVSAYYIWKNQIKSDYVCIWDHRRYLTPINFDKLDNDMIQVYYHVYEELTPFEYMIKDGINEYIIYQFIKYMIEIKHIDHNVIIDKIYNKKWKNNLWFHTCFNCNWKVFNDICDFMFGFLQYIMPNGKYEDQKSCDEFIKDLQRSFFIIKSKYKDGEMFTDNGRIESGDRDFGSIYELLLPLYCDLVWNGSFAEYADKKIGCEINDFNELTIKDEIKKWVSKNCFTGCRLYYIKTSNNKLKQLIEDNWYYIYHAPLEFCSEFPENIIILNINEYLDVESPISSNYIIKTFNI